MTGLNSWKEQSAGYDVSADVLLVTEYTLRSLKKPFEDPLAEETAAWILSLLMQLEKNGSLLCDLTTLPFSLRLWLYREPSDQALIDHILSHYHSALENSSFISRDHCDNTPVIRVGNRLYLRKNYLLESRFWHLFKERFLPYMPHDYQELSLSDEEIAQSVPHMEKGKKDSVASALRIIHNSNFLLLTGGPGSGKTYTLAIILKSLISKSRIVHPNRPLKITLAAPTGRARARMTESLHANAELADLEEIPKEGQTLHSLLHYRTQMSEETPPPLLHTDILAVDEASMIDLRLFHRLFEALAQKTKLILIGDPNQLPAVEPGAVFADMLDRRDSPKHLLKKHIVELPGSMRSLNQDINFLAEAALREETPVLQRFLIRELPEDITNSVQMVDIESLTAPQIIAWIKKQYRCLVSLPAVLNLDAEQINLEENACLDKIFRSFESLCILSARRDKHFLSAEALNQAFAPGHATEKFYHGMPVIVQKNIDEYHLVNGERGILLQNHNQLMCWFRNGSSFKSIPLSILSGSIRPCYAMTIHKSQGSEFDHVIIVLPDHCEMLISRSLLFTAITRAKHSVVLLTNMHTLDLTLRKDKAQISALSDLFANEDPTVEKLLPISVQIRKDQKTGQLNLF